MEPFRGLLAKFESGSRNSHPSPALDSPIRAVDPISRSGAVNMTSAWGKIPAEIFIIIFSFLRANAPVQSITACLRCCKTWHDLALPILYRDVLVDNNNMDAFESLPASSLAHIKSLTVALREVENVGESIHYPPLTVEQGYYFLRRRHLPGDRGEYYYYRFFRDPKAVFQAMTGLKSFSLNVLSRACPHRALTASILRNLPATCVALELDMPNRHVRECNPGEPHLCSLISAILPRLQYLRLAVANLCPAIFGPDPERFTAPFLTDFVINNGLQTYLCGQTHRDRIILYRDSTAKVITELLLRTIKPSQIPEIGRLLILDMTDSFTHKPHDKSICPALQRRDLLRKSIVAMPFFNYTASDLWQNYCVLRPTSADEIVSTYKALLSYSEGEPWQDVKVPKGCRLPAKMISEDDYLVPAPLSLGTRADCANLAQFKGGLDHVWNPEISIEDSLGLVPIESQAIEENIHLRWPHPEGNMMSLVLYAQFP